MTNDMATVGTLSTKASKALDTMRAHAVKADEARAAQVVAAATEAATANRAAAEAWERPGDPGRHTSRPVPTRGRAGRPHPAPVGALGRRCCWRTMGGMSGRAAGWRW